MRWLRRVRVARISSRLVAWSRRAVQWRRRVWAAASTASTYRLRTQRGRASPYRAAVQRPAATRKLSHGSSVVYVSRASTRLAC